MAFKPSGMSIQVLVLACCLTALAITPATSAPLQSIESFQREVRKRLGKDQTARNQLLKLSRKTNRGKPLSDKDLARKKRLSQRAIDIDADNTKWLNKHVSKFGLPAPSLIGADTTERIFVLLIHADRDRKFQKRCIELMEASPEEWPAPYAQRLKTRMSITAPLKLEQTNEPEQPKPEQQPLIQEQKNSPPPTETNTKNLSQKQ